VIGLHLIFPSIARLGWLTTTVPNPPAEEARGTVFLLRGQTAVFSRSFGTLCDRFRKVGVWAEDFRCVGDRWVSQHLLANNTQGRKATPTIFIGHSRGGRRAIQAAWKLADVGIPVDLLICVDVAFASSIPGCVRKAVHLYRSRRRLYPARPLVCIDGMTTAIENIDLDAPNSPLTPDGLHHLNITHAQRVEDWLFNRVIHEICSKRSQ
jgi:hypothetical protein